jgi:hypothetical protein
MGQTAGTAFNCLLKTQKSLEEVSGGLYEALAMGSRHMNGVADAIQATSSTALKIENVRKARPGDPTCTDVKLQVRYRKATNCDPVDAACVDMTCTPAAPAAFDYEYLDITPDQCIGREFMIPASLFDCNEFEFGQELLPILKEYVVSMYDEYNRKLAASLIAAAGAAYNGTTLTSAAPLPLYLFRQNPVSGATEPQPSALSDLSKQYRLMFGNTQYKTPVVVAGTDLFTTFNELRPFFYNSESGADSRNLNLSQYPFYLDYELTVPGATNPVITFAPGSVAIVEWYDFGYRSGDNSYTSLRPVTTLANGQSIYAPFQNASNGTFTKIKMDVGSSLLGKKFEVDFMILNQECDGQITFKMNKRFDLFHVPYACDQHNGILVWDVKCGNWTIC